MGRKGSEPRKRRTPSVVQREQNRERARVYYENHRQKVLAKLKLKYEQKRIVIQAKRRERYFQRKMSLASGCRAPAPEPHRLSLRFILN
ncbi:hypothetical protein SPRG_13775 [Saprolegnia parasitica CBS 223.65]|uniref:Uncharacterized protein n=1 Tax=Saprolegnia parasitica (strain CBS 223.65) TaxID=695850 RepID=A0A067BQ56_SAPPC|nr:hypothetical protein SPRG_13775 [Saprolegnia parasitica CBS 223.65]KDO20393.1 hypothetical protein SPRG_13775 [Saprolegnia parasitica CBS 223.65]|eukprot:XP_012208919.1 hypothetical protein SPRG_13775 [Saprolegnia parasitica CBS 223.65]